ncbi:MAG: universal stress protein [Bacteroidetes bacterium]|nr:universal stress protein [Bacteroidota bacterium]
MKKILVAVDFTECSLNALEHAISIAQHCKKDVHMLWVNKEPEKKEMFVDAPDDLTQEAIKHFDELIKRYKPSMPEGCVIDYKIRTGKIYREVVAEALETETVLIIAGTHGASGFEEFWIGSNANRIISASECPVITIRGGIDIHRPLKRIVLPVDSTLETRQKAPFTTYLAKCHNAEIYILSIYSSKVKAVIRLVDIYADQIAKYLDQEGVVYHRDSIYADNITDSTIEYAEKIDANLISIMTEQETKASNLWLGPYAQQMVNRSPFPVLSIHVKELLISSSR